MILWKLILIANPSLLISANQLYHGNGEPIYPNCNSLIIEAD